MLYLLELLEIVKGKKHIIILFLSRTFLLFLLLLLVVYVVNGISIQYMNLVTYLLIDNGVYKLRIGYLFAKILISFKYIFQVK
jgi:hypothetical protein